MPTGPGRRLFDNAYLVLVLASLGWGGNAVASRLAVGEVAPLTLTTVRWLVPVVVFLLLARAKLRAEWPVLRRHWRYALVMGAVGYTGFSALIYMAAATTSAVNIAIVQGSVPVFVLLGALALHGTTVRGIQIAGVALTLVGVAMVAGRGEIAALLDLRFALGDALMVVACVFYAAYTLGLRNRPQVSALGFFVAMSAGAVLASLPLLAYEIAAGAAFWPGRQGWAVLLYVGLVPSLMCQIFYMRGVALIGPGRAGLFVNLVPVFGALLAVLILGEPFAPYHALALALVLGGIWLAERQKGEAT